MTPPRRFGFGASAPHPSRVSWCWGPSNCWLRRSRASTGITASCARRTRRWWRGCWRSGGWCGLRDRGEQETSATRGDRLTAVFLFRRATCQSCLHVRAPNGCGAIPRPPVRAPGADGGAAGGEAVARSGASAIRPPVSNPYQLHPHRPLTPGGPIYIQGGSMWLNILSGAIMLSMEAWMQAWEWIWYD